jgi:hypothetical protein
MTAECAIEEAAELSRLRRLDGRRRRVRVAAQGPGPQARQAATVSGSDLHDVADRMLSGQDMPGAPA